MQRRRHLVWYKEVYYHRLIHDKEFLIKYYLIPSLLMSRSALLLPEEQMKAPQTKTSKSF